MRPAGAQAKFAVITTMTMLALFAWQSREAPLSIRARAEEPAPIPHNCRFWGAISLDIPSDLLVDQLITQPQSLKNLSPSNSHGWAMAYFPGEDSIPILRRSILTAIDDPLYNVTVSHAGALNSRILIGHVRNCTSGLCDIPNPHPFHRFKNGKHWFLGHNGSLDKDVLLDLIRPDYLAENPPEVGSNSEEWVDSELFFLYILQSLEDNDWDIGSALGEVVEWLRVLTPGENEQLNFVMTDGEKLYAYREGISLYFRYDISWPALGAVASKYPEEEQGSWIEMVDGQLVTFRIGAPPILQYIEDFFHHTSQAAAPVGRARLEAYPNPFNPRTTLRWRLPVSGPVRVSVHDLFGRRVALIADERMEAGEREVDWIARDDRGRALPSGVYLLRLASDQQILTSKIILMK